MLTRPQYAAQKLIGWSHRMFSKRTRFAFESNKTASLALPVSNEELLAAYASPKWLLEISHENILMHAKLRVDLFFYLLVAYHNTGLKPRLASTYLQYGRGRQLDGKILTHACHSSLITALTDDNTLVPHRKNILTHTHFMKSLNLTVELPTWVNDWLDYKLEQNLQGRKKAIDILCHTAAGEYTPLQGFKNFFLLLENALNQLEKEIFPKPNLPAEIQRKLLQLTYQGTFDNHWHHQKQDLHEEYIDALLMLWQKHDNSMCKKQLWKQRMLEVQQEIFSEDRLPNKRNRL